MITAPLGIGGRAARTGKRCASRDAVATLDPLAIAPTGRPPPSRWGLRSLANDQRLRRHRPAPPRLPAPAGCGSKLPVRSASGVGAEPRARAIRAIGSGIGSITGMVPSRSCTCSVPVSAEQVRRKRQRRPDAGERDDQQACARGSMPRPNSRIAARAPASPDRPADKLLRSSSGARGNGCELRGRSSTAAAAFEPR